MLKARRKRRDELATAEKVGAKLALLVENIRLSNWSSA
jgi:hypothetical protein